MKKKITKRLLKKKYGANIRELQKAGAFAAFFCFLCIAIIPEPIVGWGMALLVTTFAAGIYVKYRKNGGGQNPTKACFRLTTLTGKDSEAGYVSDDGHTESVTLWLLFENGDRVEVRHDEQKKAEIGKRYYVAHHMQSGDAFACFDAELYEPDDGFEVRA